jgi:hypothetical protein
LQIKVLKSYLVEAPSVVVHVAVVVTLAVAVTVVLLLTNDSNE